MYSSKKLRTGLKQHTAAGKTVSDAEEGAAANGPSPVGPLEGGNTANPQTAVNGTRQTDTKSERNLEELQGHNLELDSSMGNGPVSHRSLASNGSAAAAKEGAIVSHKNLGASHFSGRSFGSSGRVWGT